MWVLWGQGEVRQCGCCGVKVRSGIVRSLGRNTAITDCLQGTDFTSDST